MKRGNMKQHRILTEEERNQAYKQDMQKFLWVSLLGIVTGAASGFTGTVFAMCITAAVSLREQYPWILFLMPLGGLLIAWMYQKYSKPENAIHGTDLVIDSIQSSEPLPKRIVPLIFTGTVLTQLFGGSAGREGAALQIGGGIASWLGYIFKRSRREIHIMTICGMAGCFAALFGTPITAAVFAMEVATVGVLQYTAILPCTLACFTAFLISQQMGEPVTAYVLSSVPSLDLLTAGKVVLLAALCGLTAMLFCYISHQTSHLMQKWFRNPYIRVIAGGCTVVILILIFGNAYSGAGSTLIDRAIIEGQADPWGWIVKIILTAITLGAGFKGGEIVPAFSVGAVLGCTVSAVLGLDPSFGAALGFVCLFCGITNCPLASLILSAEVFGVSGSLYFMLAVAVSYILSGYTSVYSRQSFETGALKDALNGQERK